MKRGSKGEYMTGTINGVKVVCFPVNKKHDRMPDWRVLESRPQEGEPRDPKPVDQDDPFAEPS
jgi:hypothetical protein